MSERPIRVGVQLQPQQGTLAKMRETWLRVEEMGADIERSIGAFNADRIKLLDDYLAAGVTHFIMGVGGPDWDISQLSGLIAYRDRHNGG
jgi:hypothetical protein